MMNPCLFSPGDIEMKQAGFALMRSFFAFAACFLALSAPVSAASNQIFPPHDPSGNACANGTVLQWQAMSDGTYNAVCLPTLHGDMSTGNVVQNGSGEVDGPLHVQGTSAILGDYDSGVYWKNVAVQCNGAGNVGVDLSGNLHCCPLGKVVMAATATTVTCGSMQ